MGRPYLEELRGLPASYQWALREDVTAMAKFAANCADYPLISVGSGGAHTAAHMISLLHERTGGISKAITPLDLLRSTRSLREASVAILSASGRNADICRSLSCTAKREPRNVLALCMAKQTPLSRIADDYRYVTLAEFAPPYGNDGFLAVNSLFATCTLLCRAYADLVSCGANLTGDLPSPDEALRQLGHRLPALLARDTWVVIYGGWGQPVAVDLESKFTEAALGHVLLSDYRNFGHGRHHWLAKRGHHTGVLALVTSEEMEIADRTLSLLPDDIPCARLATAESGPSATLDLLFQAMCTAYLAGHAKGIDPGRPGVPEFGRRLYHLRTSCADLRQAKHSLLPDHRSQIAISRKLRDTDVGSLAPKLLVQWLRAYRAYIRRLESTALGAIVLDYDGTLCDPRERFSPLCEGVVDQLHRLLDARVTVGIATGRGGSVGSDLRKVICPRYWKQIIVGYCNGSDIAHLGDENHPDETVPLHPSLWAVREHMVKYLGPRSAEICRVYPSQISIRGCTHAEWRQIRAVVTDLVQRLGRSGICMLESTHSMDIVAPGVSKTRVVSACQEIARGSGKPEHVLCIGDRGEWPGNDYDLLSQPYSLSVDVVSPDRETCWNLCHAGHRGVQATLSYLRALSTDSGSIRFRLKDLG